MREIDCILAKMNESKVKGIYLALVISVLTFIGCNEVEVENEVPVIVIEDPNPPADGFDLAGSDDKAIEIADSVMNAMGGRKNWNDTKIIAWNFLGRRNLIWNKHTGDVRIESTKSDFLILMNIFDKTGRVFNGEEEYKAQDSLDKYLPIGEQIWINDSYWLIMPFKLKDSGVTLKYLGSESDSLGRYLELLQLTFKDVGFTPEHKYVVKVDRNNYLVSSWEFYESASDSIPDISNPWQNYEKQGNILLSGDRGDRQLTDIMVFDSLPEKVFKAPWPVDLTKFR